jgi:hypothetical protein
MKYYDSKGNIHNSIVETYWHDLIYFLNNINIEYSRSFIIECGPYKYGQKHSIIIGHNPEISDSSIYYEKK